jgi:hypothetical protein
VHRHIPNLKARGAIKTGLCIYPFSLEAVNCMLKVQLSNKCYILPVIAGESFDL